jgi:thiol-disulfide isomerase/thioredoxin
VNTRTSRTLALAVAAVVVATTIGGCSADPLAQQYESGTTPGYISGDGTIETYDPAERGDPITFTATTDRGATVSNEDYTGDVLVINFWYAACPPCRLEAPDLEKIHQEFDGHGASFLGVNVRDQADVARTFEKESGISYPSVIDANDGNMLLAFAGRVAPNAVPTTLVIDAKGRVAARFLGLIQAPSALETIIRETIAEPAS